MFEAWKQAGVKSEAMYPKKIKPENRNHFRGYVKSDSWESCYLLLSRLLLSASELNRIMPVFPMRKALP